MARDIRHAINQPFTRDLLCEHPPFLERPIDLGFFQAREAGLPGLHLNAVVWGHTILPGEKLPADPGQLLPPWGF